jgi:hypothetical protein
MKPKRWREMWTEIDEISFEDYMYCYETCEMSEIKRLEVKFNDALSKIYVAVYVITIMFTILIVMELSNSK